MLPVLDEPPRCLHGIVVCGTRKAHHIRFRLDEFRTALQGFQVRRLVLVGDGFERCFDGEYGGTSNFVRFVYGGSFLDSVPSILVIG